MFYNISSVCSINGLKDLGEIFISDAKSVMDKGLIQALKITHILNAAEGDVSTGSEYYMSMGIKYLGLQLADWPSENISLYFDQVADFIHNCLTRRGKIVVHCFMGISRSATCVIAYLIKYCGYGVDEAIIFLRRKRAQINPNSGFVSQLKDFEKSLYSTTDLIENFCGCNRDLGIKK